MSKHRMIKLVQLRTLANEAESTIRCKIRPEIRKPKLKLTRSIKHAKQSRQQAEQSGQWVSQPSQAVCESSESGQPAKQDFVAQIMRYRCCQTGKGFNFNFKMFHDKTNLRTYVGECSRISQAKADARSDPKPEIQ